MNIRKIFTLFTALFLASIASTQFVQIDRLNTVTVNQIPRYSSLSNATAAGSRPGNLILVHSGADSGVWVRNFNNTNWVRVNAAQSTTNVPNQLGSNNLKTTSFFKPVDTLRYGITYFMNWDEPPYRYNLSINSGSADYFTQTPLHSIFISNQTQRGYFIFPPTYYSNGWQYTLDYNTVIDADNLRTAILSDKIPMNDVYKVGNGVLFNYAVDVDDVRSWYARYVMFYINNSSLDFVASPEVPVRENTKFSDVYILGQINEYLGYFMYCGDSATTQGSSNTIRTTSTRDVFSKINMISIASATGALLEEFRSSAVIDLQKRFYSGSLESFYLGNLGDNASGFYSITALVSQQASGKEYVSFNKRHSGTDTAFWQDGLFNYNSLGSLNIRFAVLDTSIYMLGCYDNNNSSSIDDSTIVYRCNFSFVKPTGNANTWFYNPTFSKLGVLPFHVMEVNHLDLKSGVNASIAHLKVGSSNPMSPINNYPESYVTTNFYDLKKLPKNRVPYYFAWVDRYLNSILGWNNDNENAGQPIKYGEVEYRY